MSAPSLEASASCQKILGASGFLLCMLPISISILYDLIDRWEREVYYHKSRDFMKHSFYGVFLGVDSESRCLSGI